MRVSTIAAVAVLLVFCSPAVRAAAPELENGVTQDWWILAYKKSGGVYAWVHSLPYHWSTLFQKAHRGPLFPITSYTIRNGTIPAGTWTIEFSVDDPNIFHEKTYWDEIEVTSY